MDMDWQFRYGWQPKVSKRVRKGAGPSTYLPVNDLSASRPFPILSRLVCLPPLCLTLHPKHLLPLGSRRLL